MIEELDDSIGKLLDKLERSGLDKKTLVVFTSDHGEMLGKYSKKNSGLACWASILVCIELLFSLLSLIKCGHCISFLFPSS